MPTSEDELARDIGRVVMAWSSVELSLAVVLAAVLAVERPEAGAMIGELRYGDAVAFVRDGLEAMDLTTDTALANGFTDWAETAAALAKERHKASHQVWGYDTLNERWSTLDLTSREPKTGAGLDSITSERLPDLHREIQALNVSLTELRVALMKEHPEWQPFFHLHPEMVDPEATPD